MSRWKVFRYESETGWTWAAGEIGNLWRSCDFHTWREAQDYADRMARTREYVLPRLGAAAAEVLSRKGFIPYSPKNAETIALSMLAYSELGGGSSD